VLTSASRDELRTLHPDGERTLHRRWRGGGCAAAAAHWGVDR